MASAEFNKPPSFVMVTISGIPVTVAFMNKSDVSVSVPLISYDVEKVPVIVSSFKINSDTSLAPI